MGNRTKEERADRLALVTRLAAEGATPDQIAARLNIIPRSAYEYMRAHGIRHARQRPTSTERLVLAVSLQRMAAEGHTVEQMAQALGLGVGRTRRLVKSHHVHVPALRAMGTRLRRHDPDRIMSHVAMDAENLSADIRLIDFPKLSRKLIPSWIKSLTAAQHELQALVGRLKEENEREHHHHHRKEAPVVRGRERRAAEDHHRVQGAPGADREHADAAGAADAAAVPQVVGRPAGEGA